MIPSRPLPTLAAPMTVEAAHEAGSLIIALALLARARMRGIDRTADRRRRIRSSHRARACRMSLQFKDLAGGSITVGDAIGERPTLLIPADFTCKQICGPALTIASSALKQTGLAAGRDYQRGGGRDRSARHDRRRPPLHPGQIEASREHRS